MQFDFYTEYQTWTDAQLRAVVLNPHNYQPDAVSVAETILMERNVPLVEEAPAPRPVPEWIVPGPADGEETDLLGSLLEQPKRALAWPQPTWMRVLFIVTALTYAWGVYSGGRNLYSYFGSGGSLVTVACVIACSFFLLDVLTVYLAARGDSWGWYLVCGSNSFVLLAQVISLGYYLLRSPYGLATGLWSSALLLLLRAALLAGFFQGPVRSWFGIPPSGRWMVLLAAALLWAGYMGVMFSQSLF
ncbi:hypothetical protein [Flaviaesturariibacter terrae]